MNDNLDEIWNHFFDVRNVDLFHRFPGWYRAEVVETNDPLNDYRVRVRIPELHDQNVKIEDCPWAIRAPWLGGQGSGFWGHPMIKDWVWVVFEKNHPYVPIWCGFAMPTRRKFYAHQSIYTQSAPVPTDSEGDPSSVPDDHVQGYTPQDGRPMTLGVRDRYGTFFTLNSTGYFPVEHKNKPTSPGIDGLNQGNFNAAQNAPVKNDPDCKFAAIQTKYGHTFILGDQGYDWQKEFQGDFNSDEAFEEARSKYLVKFFNEGKPKDWDQRRIMFWSRYGHKFEMREVGWEMSRDGEPFTAAKVGDSKGRDERWMKLRTKAGMLIEGIDVGADPVQDTFISELNQSEYGDTKDTEASLGKDQRMLRFVTRHGAMFILDDRGSDVTAADANLTPHGNGLLMRTRAGHQIQAVDKEDVNSLMMTTPKDQVFEMNAKFGYVLLTTQQTGPVHTTIDKPTGAPKYFTVTGKTQDPLKTTYHFYGDSTNHFLRVATPEQQGIEFRDSDAPCGTWTQIRDNEDRGLWMSKTDQQGIWRDKTGQMYMLLDDINQVIVIRNELKHVQIFAQQDVEIIANRNICIKAEKKIGIKAGQEIAFEAGGQQFVMDAVGFGTKGLLQCREMHGIHPHFTTKKDEGGSGSAPDPRGAEPCVPEPRKARRTKPEPIPDEEGCDPLLPQEGPVPPSIYSPSPGGGGGGGSSGGGNSNIPQPKPIPPSPNAPKAPSAGLPPPPPPPQNPVFNNQNQNTANPGGVLWYGTSSVFLDAIKTTGLSVQSFINNLNIPPLKAAKFLQLARTESYAAGKFQALLAQRRYGGTTVVLRVRSVPDGTLLTNDPTNNANVVDYAGNIPFEGNLEIFDIGTTPLALKPLYPNIT